jgi:hypothetical protein
MVELDASGE